MVEVVREVLQEVVVVEAERREAGVVLEGVAVELLREGDPEEAVVEVSVDAFRPYLSLYTCLIRRLGTGATLPGNGFRSH